MLVFEEAGVGPWMYTDETAARKAYEEAKITWNCHLFRQVESSPAPAAPEGLEQQVDELIGQTLDKHWTEELPIKVAVTLRDELCKFVRAALAESEGRVAKAREAALKVVSELHAALFHVAYEYTKSWYGPNGEEQMPRYKCRFCNQETERPQDVPHSADCRFIKVVKMADELRALRLTAPGRSGE